MDFAITEAATSVARLGISGLYDGEGSPAALASGWMTVQEGGKAGKARVRRPYFFVMTPTAITFFEDEGTAAVDDDGFLKGDADHNDIEPGKLHGARLLLDNVAEVAVQESDPKTLHIILKADVKPKTDTMVLECTNQEVCFGWAEALRQQVVRASAISAPLPAAKRKSMIGQPGTSPGGMAALGSSARNLLGTFFTSSKAGGGGAPAAAPAVPSGTACTATMTAANYTAVAPWEDREMDLTAKRHHKLWVDAEGHPAVVRYGLLTKRNKSGSMRSSVEKDRVFVLTVHSLAFFPDEASAKIVDGYLLGEASGERISGLFTKVGARLALESVCDISFGLKDGSEMGGWVPPPAGQVTKRVSRPSAGIAAVAEGEAFDVGSTVPAVRSVSGERPAMRSVSGERPKGEAFADLLVGERVPPRSPSSVKLSSTASKTIAETACEDGGEAARLRSSYFEVDFGEFNLQVNARTTANCVGWVQAIKKWAAIRRAAIDSEMLYSLGGK